MLHVLTAFCGLKHLNLMAEINELEVCFSSVSSIYIRGEVRSRVRKTNQIFFSFLNNTIEHLSIRAPALTSTPIVSQVRAPNDVRSIGVVVRRKIERCEEGK